jgi:hypothetical protein
MDENPYESPKPNTIPEAVKLPRSNDDLNHRISERQRSIIRLSTTFIAIIVVCWAPIAAQAPGTPCRPMGQALIDFLLLLFGMPVLLLRVVRQSLAAWPQKWPGLIAIMMLVAPIAVYALLQWLILDVRGIIYED